MAKIVTMGEIMLRLSTPGNERFIQADSFDVNYGGGEANVAVSLARFGHEAEFVTALPDNPIGECALAELRKYNVGTKHIARCGERLGIYFLETGSAMRASNVVYDRAHSAICTARPEDFDFNEIFHDAKWFHFTGITPAVSDSAPALTEAALKAAKAHGVTVSVDLNFRKKLWSSEKAREVMTGLMEYVDVCIGNEEDAQKVLGFKPGNTDVAAGELELPGYVDIFNQMAGGRLWGSLFFVFMSFAALSTVIAVFENIISFAIDLWGWSRKKAVLVNLIAILILSMPCVLGFNLWSSFAPLGAGSTIQDLEDFIVSNNLLPLGSLVYLLFCTSRYGWGWDKFIAEADAGEGIKFPKWARFYVTYILPLIVLFIFVMGYWQKFAG